jgi:putative transcriptional regulator
MSTAGKRLIESAEEALAFAKGKANAADYRVHIPEEINIKRIRQQFRMSQVRFAMHFGFSVRTIQEWEQGRSVPRGVSRHFLMVIQKEPDAVAPSQEWLRGAPLRSREKREKRCLTPFLHRRG